MRASWYPPTPPVVRVLFALAVVALSLPACSGAPKLEEVQQQHRPAVEAMLALIPPIRDQVTTLPELDHDGFSNDNIATTVTLAQTYRDGVDTLVAYEEDLADLETLGKVYARPAAAGVLNECASVLRRGHAPVDGSQPNASVSARNGEEANKLFWQCEAAKWLLVIRTLAFVEPAYPATPVPGFIPSFSVCSARPAGSESPPLFEWAPRPAPTPLEIEAPRPFDGGMFRGEVLLFELATGKYQGGFRVGASSSVRVRTTPYLDLREAITASIEAGLKRFAPRTRIAR